MDDSDERCMKSLRIIFTFHDGFALENHIFNVQMIKRRTDVIWRDVNVEATLLFYVLFTASKGS